jgi:hypothetical protein
MPRPRRRAIAARSACQPWYPRACIRRAVTLRMDYVTAQGLVGLGLVRDLSLQGMYVESAGDHGTPEGAPGTCGRWPSYCPRSSPVNGDCHG